MQTVWTDTQFGIKGDGSDETAKLQAAMTATAAGGEALQVTKVISINPNGVTAPDNSVIYFKEGSLLSLLPTSIYNYDLLYLSGNNIKIYNPRIDGNNETNSADPTNAIGMGIAIAGASNVTIRNPQVKNVFGDGIYIRGSYTSGNTPPSNINISGARISGCNRDAVSVVSVNGLTITDLEGRDTLGQLPACLIDFEPNVNGDILQGIKVIGARSINNSNGLRFSFQNLPGPIAQAVDINISGFEDQNALTRAIYWVALTKGSYTVSGSININSPVFKHSAFTYGSSTWDNSVVVTVNNPTVIA